MKNAGEKEGKRPVSASALARIIIWSVVFCILTGLFVAGMLNGILRLDWVGMSAFHSTVLRYDDDEYSVGNGVSNATVTEISVEWVAGNVTVVEAEGNEITVTDDYNGEDEKMRLRWRIEDGELSVKFCKPNRIGRKDAIKKNLTVAIPAAMLEAMDEVEISVVSGNITYTGNADELSLDAVEGDLAVTGDIGKMEVDAVDGDVTFRGGVRQGSFGCVDADVTMYLDMAANLDFDQVDGDVRLYLSEEITGFSVELSSLDTHVSTDGFEDVRRDGKDACWGDESLRVRMSGVMNKLEIKKSTKN